MVFGTSSQRNYFGWSVSKILIVMLSFRVSTSKKMLVVESKKFVLLDQYKLHMKQTASPYS